MKRHRFPGVHIQGRKLYTKSAISGASIYTDILVKVDGKTYRHWQPFRSKPSAMILKGCSRFPFRENSKVLYLGAGNGTTASFLADICCKGKLFCLEFSKRPYRDLMAMAEKRGNVFPMLGDANHPERYDFIVDSDVSILYQDISQRNQVEIFLRNMEHFSEIDRGILMLKARSVDVTKKPSQIFEQARKEIEGADYEVLEMVNLSPHIKDHVAMSVKR
jgi:fibrillarin-like pre-rRNA processing protein